MRVGRPVDADEIIADWVLRLSEAQQADSQAFAKLLAEAPADARSVFDLLDRAGQSGGSNSPPRSSTESQPGTTPAFQIGDVILEKYQLGERIGQGGFAFVHSGVELDTGRQVAIKIPQQHVMNSGERKQRFVQEALCLERINDPHVVRLIDFGFSGEVPILICERVSGPNLFTWMQSHEKRLDPLIAARIVWQAAQGAGAVHKQNIVVRDIAPSNLMLDDSEALAEHRDGLGFVVRLVDLGLAKLNDRLVEQALTVDGSRIGTPAFMAPEQRDPAQPHSPATDVYALGALLYWLLTQLSPPWRSPGLFTRTRFGPKTTGRIREHRPDVPVDLERICECCLEEHPADRYPDAAALADDLGRLLAGDAVHARHPSRLRRGWRNLRRVRMRAWPQIAALVALGAVVSVILVGRVWHRDHQELSEKLRAAQTVVEQASVLKTESQYTDHIRQAAQARVEHGYQEVLAQLDQAAKCRGGRGHCGPEWWYLWRQAHPLGSYQWLAHPGGAYCASFSPSGRLLATGGEDGRAVLWEVDTWRRLAEYRDGVGDVNVVEFSRDETKLVIAGDDGRIVVHRLSDGRMLRDDKILSGRIYCLTWLENTEECVVGGENGVIVKFDLEAGEIARGHITGDHSQPISQGNPIDEVDFLSFLPSHDIILAGVAPGRIVSLTSDLTFIRSAPDVVATQTASCLVSSKLVATAGGINGISVWDATEPVRIENVAYPEQVRGIAYSVSARRLAAVSIDGAVQTWEFDLHGQPRFRKAERTLSRVTKPHAVTFSSDGRWLAIVGQDGTACVFSENSYTDYVDHHLALPIQKIHFSPCERYAAMVVGAKLGDVRVLVFDAETGQMLWSHSSDEEVIPQPDESCPVELAFTRDGDRLVLSKGSVGIWEYASRSGAILNRFDCPLSSPVVRLLVSADGKEVLFQAENSAPYRASLTTDQAMVLLDSKRRLLGCFSTIWGDHYWESCKITDLLLRRTYDGPVDRRLFGLSANTQSGAASPSGTEVAIGCQDGEVLIWTLPVEGLARRFARHQGRVHSVVYSLDGRSLLSFSRDDRTLRFWNVAAGLEMLTLGSDANELTIAWIAISPSNDALVLAGHRGERWQLQVHHLSENPTKFVHGLQLPADVVASR